MTNEDALWCADHLQAGADDPMWANHTEMPKAVAEKSAAHIRRLVAENETLRLDAGTLRLCLTCGKTKPSDEPQHEPLKTCEADPDMGHLCHFDATPQEAWQHWSRVAHERAAEIASLKQSPSVDHIEQSLEMVRPVPALTVQGDLKGYLQDMERMGKDLLRREGLSQHGSYMLGAVEQLRAVLQQGEVSEPAKLQKLKGSE